MCEIADVMIAEYDDMLWWIEAWCVLTPQSEVGWSRIKLWFKAENF